MDVKKYLEAGKIVSVFGIKGEIKVQHGVTDLNFSADLTHYIIRAVLLWR